MIKARPSGVRWGLSLPALSSAQLEEFLPQIQESHRWHEFDSKSAASLNLRHILTAVIPADVARTQIIQTWCGRDCQPGTYSAC
jgi:hypothetical protein